jgi:LacI family transcriptional regulator
VATIKEVARHAKVSVGTVSNILSGRSVAAELRERVDASILALDYHPNHIARSLKSKHTETLGMVISDITNPFFPLVVRGAEDAASEQGYSLITFNTDDRVDRERQILSLLRSRRVDGLLLVVAPNVGDGSHIDAVIDDGIPIVCLDRIPNHGKSIDSVSVDNVKGAQMCVQHLIMRGHTRIAMITGSLALRNARERLTGYERAMADAGIEIDRSLIAEGDFREESGRHLGKDLLLRHKRPTALFVSNGMMTIGVLEALEEMGLSCPDDIALATFDDLPVARVFRPHLTAVVQPCYQIGYQGAELLLHRIRGELPKKLVDIRLEPELKIRESTNITAQSPATLRKSGRQGLRRP